MADQRLTDKGEITAVDLSDLVHVVDVSDTTANALGTSKKSSVEKIKTAVLNGIISADADNAAVLGADNGIFVPETTQLLNKPVENRYITLAAMLADQANQTTGFLNIVDDPDDEPNSGYYEKLSTSAGVIGDYKKLTADEVAIVENSNEWQIKNINAIQLSFASYVTLIQGRIFLETDNTNINFMIFDAAYTKILEKAVALSGSEDFYFNIYNKSRNTNIRPKWESSVYVDGGTKLRVAVSGFADNEVGVLETLHLGLPINVGGSLPTIHQVLTQGNLINALQEVRFDDPFGTYTSLYSEPNLFRIETDSEVRINSSDKINQLRFSPLNWGILSKDDYSSYTTGTPSDDEKIYAQRKYVDDTKNLTTGYTVATLPTGTTGQIAHVTDATTVTYRGTATGGGANVALVMFDGTNWIYH